MKDEKAREFMSQYMVPSSRDNGINGIKQVTIKGDFSERDFAVISSIFDDNAKVEVESNKVTVKLNENQVIDFIKFKNYEVDIYTDSDKGKCVPIENVNVYF